MKKVQLNFSYIQSIIVIEPSALGTAMFEKQVIIFDGEYRIMYSVNK